MLAICSSPQNLVGRVIKVNEPNLCANNEHKPDDGLQPHTLKSSPDPVGLAVTRESEKRVRPAEIILNGSRAAGDYRPDSDVDLMAAVPDEETD